MSLPDWLLVAIVRTLDDEVEQERLARRWQAVLPRMAELEARIRKQVAARREPAA